MNKKKKVLITVLLIVVLFAAAVIIAGNYVLDYAFEKVSEGIISTNTSASEKQEDATEKTETEQTETVVIAQDGTEYVEATEDDKAEDIIQITGEDGKVHNVKKHTEPKKEENMSSVDRAIKDIYSLTPQEISDIQAMVKPSDKIAVLNIVKSSLTLEDKRELKRMLDSGNIDYGRVRVILSQRLSGSQKAQIYAYYEKYAQIYFGS